MKFIVAILLTALLGFAAPLYFSWWSFALSSFIIAVFIPQKPFIAFISAFAGLFFLWAVMAFIIDSLNKQLLSHKIAQVLPLQGSSILLLLITAFTGGLISGFAGLSGSFVRKPEARL